MNQFEEFENELKKINDEFAKKIDENSHKVKIDCIWTRCDDGTHYPEENGKYLIIDKDGGYDVVNFFKKGSVIMRNEHKEKGYHVDVITDNDGFFFYSTFDNGCPTLIDNVIGYVKISDINIFKVGEKNE